MVGQTIIYQASFSLTAMGFRSTAPYRIAWSEKTDGREIDAVWTRFQRIDIGMMPPEGYEGRSLSIGDVVSIGFKFYTPEFDGWHVLTPEELCDFIDNSQLIKHPTLGEYFKIARTLAGQIIEMREEL